MEENTEETQKTEAIEKLSSAIRRSSSSTV